MPIAMSWIEASAAGWRRLVGTRQPRPDRYVWPTPRSGWTMAGRSPPRDEPRDGGAAETDGQGRRPRAEHGRLLRVPCPGDTDRASARGPDGANGTTKATKGDASMRSRPLPCSRRGRRRGTICSFHHRDMTLGHVNNEPGRREGPWRSFNPPPPRDSPTPLQPPTLRSGDEAQPENAAQRWANRNRNLRRVAGPPQALGDEDISCARTPHGPGQDRSAARDTRRLDPRVKDAEAPVSRPAARLWETRPDLRLRPCLVEVVSTDAGRGHRVGRQLAPWEVGPAAHKRGSEWSKSCARSLTKTATLPRKPDSRCRDRSGGGLRAACGPATTRTTDQTPVAAQRLGRNGASGPPAIARLERAADTTRWSGFQAAHSTMDAGQARGGKPDLGGGRAQRAEVLEGERHGLGGTGQRGPNAVAAGDRFATVHAQIRHGISRHGAEPWVGRTGIESARRSHSALSRSSAVC